MEEKASRSVQSTGSEPFETQKIIKSLSKWFSDDWTPECVTATSALVILVKLTPYLFQSSLDSFHPPF